MITEHLIRIHSQFKFKIMKKIFTLLISATLFTSAFAQHRGADYNNNKRNEVSNREMNERDSRNRINKRQLDMKIMQVNRDYDARIQAIQGKPFLNRNKKARQIAILEEQRRTEIRFVYASFNDKGDRNAQKRVRSQGQW